MRKFLSMLLVGIMLVGGVSMGTAAETSRGDIMGFIAGCCFGIRTGAAYNDGKEVHWREWIMLVPIANLVCSIWNGLEGYKGVTSAEYATRYGSTFY